MAKRKVDFGEVPEEIRKGKRSRHVPEGDYLLKIIEGSWEEGEKADYISWQFQIVQPKKYKGVTVYDNTSLSKKALWNLRNLIFAAKGKNVAGKSVNFDPETLFGSIIGATIADDEYKKDGNSTIRSRPVDYFPKDKYEESEDEEEDDDDETEVEEEDEDEELEDVDVEDL